LVSSVLTPTNLRGTAAVSGVVPLSAQLGEHGGCVGPATVTRILESGCAAVRAVAVSTCWNWRAAVSTSRQ
jgi:hypothetical protein